MARHPLIGYLAWAVLFGALFAWEGLALAGVSGVPSLRPPEVGEPQASWPAFSLSPLLCENS